jgi:hypothetical protein
MTSYLLSGPATEPVTLDEARAYVRMDDTGEDALLATLITAARLHVESVTGRALLSQGWRLVLDCWPGDRIVPLPVAPALSLTAITAYAGRERRQGRQRRELGGVGPDARHGAGGVERRWRAGLWRHAFGRRGARRHRRPQGARPRGDALPDDPHGRRGG